MLNLQNMLENMQINEFQVSCSSILVALAAVLCSVWLLTRKLFLAGNDKNLLPSPPKLPIIGNLHQLGRLPHRSLATLSEKYGPLMFLQLGNKRAVVISSAAVAKEAVKTHDISFSGKPGLIATKQLYYNRKGLFFSPYGDQWRMLRKLYRNHLLHKRMVKSFHSIIDEETSILIESIKMAGSALAPVNLTEMLATMTNNIIRTTVFGKKCGEGEEGRKMMEVIAESVQLLFAFPIGEFIPWLVWTNRWNGFDAALDRICRTKDDLLEARIQEYLETSDGELDGQGDCFADILARLHKGNTPGMHIDRDTYKAVIQDVLGAGTNSTSAALVWVMTELLRHPEVMNKLQNEVRGIMDCKEHITNDDLEKMQYLKAVIKENLRLHPLGAIALHETIEDAKLMGYDIPSGAMVLFNLWAICRDPACWDEPEKFLPERFLNSSVDYNGFDFHFIPFGSGRRICPGISFATASVERVLANLMREFDWQLPNGAKGEDLNMDERPGVSVGRFKPLFVVPTKPSL